ncbi:hypothetical protein [Lentilactobacillus buchneri]|uniref:hypothetical protein n=3 Tax=Lentilactobacillus buchneri TaxID=1581 RepID=UPI0002F45006|nr:hypothetical protein [Lentilactobacillus buchneri]KRK69362.1 hypothetical protein FC79_GL001740 [Lentilactobacillus buchneri DSM 20057]WCJ51093.1 hypothetical protein OKF32_07275 [Lentilactobacillus sp. Egmn17]MQM61362.1 hypothetical protein [Lentilactobacillus buchneri]MQM71460.1 hypothetical protein [Lentilactobacillus buchneri]MQM78501.1 hypothetical protein [Lentilactobacillus buchneri]
MDNDTLSNIQSLPLEYPNISVRLLNNQLRVEMTMPQNDSEQGTPDLLSSNKDLSSSTSVASSSPNVRVLDYSDVIQNMDEANGDSNTPNGTLLGAYPGQNVGDHVSTGTHVHCNRFNGPKSDHRYWSHSSAKGLADFAGSDCYWHLAEYGCYEYSMGRCDGLNHKNKGVHDCSSWSGGLFHSNWPKTAWYR